MIGLFDEIKTDHLIYVKRNREMSDEFKSGVGGVLVGTMDISGYNLLAIDNDIASYYFFSAVNNHGPHKVDLKLDVTRGDRVQYRGLWSSNAEAINLWYPETMVMDARITSDRAEFNESLPPYGGMVAHNVILMLKEKNWGVGLVKGSDGYASVEPLLPDGKPKNERWGARVQEIF